MPRNKSTSRARSNQRAAKTAVGAPTNPDWPTLKEAIEAERSRLMTADAILHGVIIAMDADDTQDPDSPDYQTLVALARDLVKQAIDQLDSVRLRPMVEQTGGKRGK